MFSASLHVCPGFDGQIQIAWAGEAQQSANIDWPKAPRQGTVALCATMFAPGSTLDATKSLGQVKTQLIVQSARSDWTRTFVRAVSRIRR